MSETALGTVVGNLAHAAPHRAALTETWATSRL
jgi:hypothetical protein